MLNQEFQYYRNNQDALVAQYNGRFLTIVGDQVIGDYSSYLEAYVKTKSSHEPGTFLIQECTPGNQAYTVNYHNRLA